MGRMMRAHNWAATPLGPVSSWPQSLRTAVSMMLETQFPMLIAWGNEFLMLYNDGYRPVLGASKHPALGRPLASVFSESWDQTIGPLFAQVLAGSSVGFTDYLFLLDRYGYLEETYFLFSYSPIRDESGGVGGVLVTCAETTQRVLGERRLATLRALAAGIVEAHTPEQVCHRAATVLSDNRADLPFVLLYVLSPDGKHAHLAGTTQLPAGTTASPQSIALSDEQAPWPLHLVADSGQPMLVEECPPLVASPLSALATEALPAPQAALVLPMTRAGEEQLSGFLVAGLNPRRALDEGYRGFLQLVAGQVATGIASARAYQEAEARARALAELDRAKTVFFNNISHEFRTPLTLTLGPLETLLAEREHPLPPEQRTQVEMARRNALRQLKLVNTLLDFARIEAGRVEAVYEPTDLCQLTTDLASAFRAAIEKAGLQLLMECAQLPEPIYVDRKMWEKIVLNLLSNAFKFTFEGCIRVTLHPVEEGIELVVQDSGVGIREADIPHVFERFYRTQAPRARSQEGSGIGLSLVQELVRLHAGSITVQSTQGVGTTFTVHLPAGTSHLPAEQVQRSPQLSSTVLGTDPYVEEALRWLPEEREEALVGAGDGSVPLPTSPAILSPAPGAGSRRDRVLVVDDNADMRSYLKRLLSPSYRVLLAADGNTAFALARGVRPALIIADVMMPGMDGVALLRTLRSERSTADIPVVLLSARAGEEATVEGLQQGANDYLAKPFSPRELLARVQLWLEIARLRTEAELARQHLHNLLMQAPALICVLRGPEHIYELVNPLYQQLFGDRSLLGKTIREALPELEGQGIYELLEQVYRSGEAFVGTEVRVELDRDNTGHLEEVYFNFVYQPIRSRDEVEGIMVHAVDVTEQVRARQRMQTFLGIASHELKNPLTSIRGNIQIARRQAEKLLREQDGIENRWARPLETVKALLERAERQVVFENRLVSDLIDTSRIQAGKLELRLTSADLNELVREAVEEQRQLAPTRTIHLQQAEVSPLLVLADADRIRQVVTNYLSNALKYSGEEQAVAVSVEAMDTEARVAVRDRGVGLSEEEQARVWEHFYRAPGVQVQSGSGTGLGLGLYICQTIIGEHGGRVGVESVQGRGSTFWATLPRVPELKDSLPASGH